jgi:CDGSH-type Zn-finger protein
MCLKPLAKRSSNEVLLLRINTLLLQRSGLCVLKNFCSGTYAKLSFYGHDQVTLLRVAVDPFLSENAIPFAEIYQIDMK